MRAASTAAFLEVDTNLVRLLEVAASRAADDGTRSLVLARLARELLGDASAAARRRALADEALELARHAGNPRTLAEVLDARLHALWDPAGAEDRLAAGSEIIDLARAAGDDRRERLGLFWRFVALMELGRVAEAESALAAFEQRAAAAGDAEAVIMVTARRAMLAVLRGRFDQASQLAGDVAAEARRVRLADAEGITGTLIWSVAAERGDRAGWETVVTQLLAAAGRQPGHLFEATAARILVLLGRDGEAGAELERLLPFALASRGRGGWARWPTWRSRPSLSKTPGQRRSFMTRLPPTRGGWWCGQGLTAPGDRCRITSGCWRPNWAGPRNAVRYFEQAVGLEQQTGALPFLARSLDRLAGALIMRDGAEDAARASGHRRRARAIAGRLGMTVLLERLSPAPDEWTLTRDGDDWLLEAGAGACPSA